MINLLKNTSIYSTGLIFPKIINFFLLPLYTRYLIPEDYGILNSMNLLGVILSIFFTLAINRSIPRLYFDYKDEKRKEFLGTIFISLVIIGASVSLLCLFVFSNLLNMTFESISFYPYYVYMIINTFLVIFSYLPLTYFMVEQKPKKFIILTITKFLLESILRIYFLIYLKNGAQGQLFAIMLSSLIYLPIYLFIIFQKVKLKFNIDILKNSLSFSLPMIPSLLSAWVLNLSDRVFIAHYFNMSDVGIYSLGYRIGGLVLIFSSAFYQAYTPVFFRTASICSKNELAKEELKKSNSIFMITVIIISFVISFFSKEIIILLTDIKYHEAYKIVPIIAIAYMIGQSGGIHNLSIYQEKKTKQIMYMIVCSAFVNIFLNYILIRPFGAYGAAFATLITFFIFWIIKYIYSKKCFFVGFYWNLVLPVFIGSLAMIILSYFVLFNNMFIEIFVKLILVFLFILFLFLYNRDILNILLKKECKN